MTINTDLSRLWYKVLFGSKTDVITEFPYIFNTMQNKLSDWELFGNVEVSGTPTPDSPVMPQGTGERTGNLFDFEQLKNAPSGTIGSITFSHVLTLQLKANTYYTMASNGTGSASSTPADLYRSVYFNATTGESSVNKNNPVTVLTDSTGVVRIGFFSERTNAQQYLSGEAQLWINEGSTALPYEPYGIKIPISSANTTTPVYLGEVQSTRRVKKLVLTGQEDIIFASVTQGNLFRYQTAENLGIEGNIIGICSHYPVVTRTNRTNKTLSGNSGLTLMQFDFIDNDYSDSTGFKTFLQQQYAAGTPVTVWYVLAETTTGIVNEPLMRIGDYADSMSRTQTGIDIPTVIGQNTLDVLTTVKPSSMSIEYTSADENQSRSRRISLLKSPLKKGLIK